MFSEFKKAMQESFALLITAGQHTLYRTEISKEVLWDTYLNNFPEEVRQEYNCHCCKSFITHYGSLVAIVGNEVHSIWNFYCQPPFNKVIQELNQLVVQSPIADRFFTTHPGLGTDSNVQLISNSPVSTVRWQHLFFQLPKEMVTRRADSIATLMGEARDNFNVLKRSLDEITIDTTQTVLELIAQNTLYRGAEFTHMLEEFLKLQKQYEMLPAKNKGNFCWANSHISKTVSRIRNTAVGTLLIDIAEGKDLDIAVTAFERLMAPANYKRPTAIISKKMIEEAEKTIESLGYAKSLGRRFAAVDDLTANNLLFVNRDRKKATGTLGELKENVVVNPKSITRLEEIPVDKFLKDVLPKCTSVEVLFENRHVGNLMSLTTASDPSAPSMFKWDNPFCWTYKNSMADSLKEKVKAAGGATEGELRISLEWYNFDDLDLHVLEPGGHRIYFRDKISVTGGKLDVDMNAVGAHTRQPVENIIWPTQHKMREGRYQVYVNQFSHRENVDVGFSVEIECQGQLLTFGYDRMVQEAVRVAQFDYTRAGGLVLVEGLEHTGKTSTQKVWGIDTNKFHKVSMILNSPNYWEGQYGRTVGNAHLFFIIDQAHNDEQARGFYNEFLKPELEAHKRVFEALGSRMKVEPADKQVTGLGFSSTQHGDLICKVEGTFNRTLRIKF